MIIRLDNVSFSYEEGNKVLRNLTLQVEAGEALLVVGRNGAGKSTLLKLLNGILHPTSGEIIVNGLSTASHPTSTLAAHVGVTFQNPSHQIFAPTVQRETEFGPRSLRRENPAELAAEALRLFRIEGTAALHPYDLSLAERKLLTIASAVASDPALLAFDEPTVQLSLPERDILLEAFGILRERGKTLLIVSHDFESFLPFCSKILVLSQGAIHSYGEPRAILDDPSILRKAGVRLPLSQRLRTHFGLPLLPSDGRRASREE